MKKGMFDFHVKDNLNDTAPDISFWVATVFIAIGEWRVWDAILTLTNGNIILAVGALGATGLMFFVWKNNWQYKHANDLQKRLSFWGMIISLVSALYFGGLDYYLKSNLVDMGTWGQANNIFNALIILGGGHVAALLLYWYKDPRIEAFRVKLQQESDVKSLNDDLMKVDSLLTEMLPVMQKYEEIKGKFGEEAANAMLRKMGVDPEVFKGIRLNRLYASEAEQPKDFTKGQR